MSTPTSGTDLSDKTIKRIQKLLNLAGNNPNEHEAAAAMEAAHALLAEYNLSLGDVTAHVKAVAEADQGGARQEAKVRGGFYQWQRDIWWAVGRLNFCVVLTQGYTEKVVNAKTGAVKFKKQRRLLVIGREVNVLATQVMGQYLMDAVERFCMDWLGGDNKLRYTASAISWREGCAYRLVKRIDARAEAAKRGEVKGESGTALVLASHYAKEKEANDQFVKGELGYKVTIVKGKQATSDVAAWHEGERKGRDIGLDAQLKAPTAAKALRG